MAGNYGVPQRGVPQRIVNIINNTPRKTMSARLVVAAFGMMWILSWAALGLFTDLAFFTDAFAWSGVASLVLVGGYFVGWPLLKFVRYLVLDGFVFPLDRLYDPISLMLFGALPCGLVAISIVQRFSLKHGAGLAIVCAALGAWACYRFFRRWSGRVLWSGVLGTGRPDPQRVPMAVSEANSVSFIDPATGARMGGFKPAAATAAAELVNALVIASPVEPAPAPFALRVGLSTGRLANLGHGAGIAPRQVVALSQEDAAQNIVIFGGIGGGKTVQMISPLLLQVLEQDAGALIFDIKGNFIKQTTTLAKRAGRSFQVVGDGGMACNLLAGLTPETASKHIKSAFLLSSKKGSDGFWIDTATELCRNGLGLLQYISGKYSLAGLYEYIFDNEAHTDVHDAVDALLAGDTLNTRDRRALTMYRSYYEGVFSRFSDEVKSGVQATAAQVLSPFRHPDLQDAFCGADDALEQVDFTDLVNKGSVLLVEIPRAKYGDGARLAYLLVKLRFMNMMDARYTASEWNQTRPVAFVCDEYQAIVDGISDPDFWDKSRESGCIGIVAMQGYTSLIHAVGDKVAAANILQNFRQRMCFATEDMETIKLAEFLFGQVDREVANRSMSASSSTNPEDGTVSTTESSSVSVNQQRKSVFGPQEFRELAGSQALAMLRIGRNNFDDVIEASPVFVD
ncbi:MAG: type IV secretory system conjugative DNA transfer family protein [Paraburkholderia sp.]|uniref:type IV secretory system conjugative DNA transfer family protein n=1 Tax=Paraburkholderia sp. TaxID=1926495 RepID=UPI00121476BB|nr:type IV secretion system DNA-binding domain-containing protein [Paraburkholderia sp.]TAM01715.1 MAG: type IV secretory system conjugative DNA transfer family protein [Paraburkholderia sp.]